MVFVGYPGMRRGRWKVSRRRPWRQLRSVEPHHSNKETVLIKCLLIWSWIRNKEKKPKAKKWNYEQKSNCLSITPTSFVKESLPVAPSLAPGNRHCLRLCELDCSQYSTGVGSDSIGGPPCHGPASRKSPPVCLASCSGRTLQNCVCWAVHSFSSCCLLNNAVYQLFP